MVVVTKWHSLTKALNTCLGVFEIYWGEYSEKKSIKTIAYRDSCFSFSRIDALF